MENLDIADLLGEFADLLEIKGANPFRIRAYRNALRTIGAETRSMASMVEADADLTELPGIGKDLAAQIRELVTTGSLASLVELRKEVPPGVRDLLSLSGLGPKKAARLWKELEVASVEEAEEAAQSGRVASLSGFGAKSAERLLVSIEEFRRHQGRILLSEADERIRPILEWMRAAPGVTAVEGAGSWRRRRETVGDLDVIVACDESPGPVVDQFTKYPSVARVDGAGDTKASVVLRSGLQVDLRVVPQAVFGAALHHFTGSKEHNVAMRRRAQKMGLRVSEWGVFPEPEGVTPVGGAAAAVESLAGSTEEDVFEVLGLQWIPPVLREDRGEIEASLEDALPELVTAADLHGDLHMHSTWSDGKTSIREMVEACRDRGYSYMAISDHSQAVTVANGLTPDRVREQWLEIDEIRAAVEGIEVFRSLEVDILRDGSLDMPDEILADLDLVIVSVHSHFDLPGKEMTDRIIRGLEHPSVHILGHPTGRLLGRRDPYAVDVEAVLQAAVDFGVAVELNANPRRLDLSDRWVRRASDLGVLVAIDTDAHRPGGLDLMGYGLDQAGRGWLRAEHVLNAKPVDEFRSWLSGRRGGS